MLCKICGKETENNAELCRECQAAKETESTMKGFRQPELRPAENAPAQGADSTQKATVSAEEPDQMTAPAASNDTAPAGNNAANVYTVPSENTAAADNHKKPLVQIITNNSAGEMTEYPVENKDTNFENTVAGVRNYAYENAAKSAEKPKKKKGSHKGLKIFITIVVLLALVGGGVYAIFTLLPEDKNKDTTDDSNDNQVVEKQPEILTSNEIGELMDSILLLTIYDENRMPMGTGSGFVIGNTKTLVTNFHVVDQAYDIKATANDNSTYTFKGVKFFDVDNDIAILEFNVDPDLPVLDIADSDKVLVGDHVYALGSPLGIKNILSDGLVSAVRESKDAHEIQVTAPISPGSSGGALVNDYGQVIGITYASYVNGQNMNLVIPANLFADHLDDTEVHSFEENILLSRPMGNTIENYNSGARLAEYGEYIFHNYNAKYEIMMKKGDKKEVSIGEKGKYLNVINDKLYFVPTDNGKLIKEYDIESGECREFHNSDKRIGMLYATRHGIIVVAEDGDLVIRVDFDGNEQERSYSCSSNVRLFDDELLLGYDHEFGYFPTKYPPMEIDVYATYDLFERMSIDLGSFFENGIYTIGKDVIYAVFDDDMLIYEDLVTGDMGYADIEGWDDENCTISISGEKVYYFGDKGTYVTDTDSGSKAPNSFSEMYYYGGLSFTRNGDVYGIWNDDPTATKYDSDWQYLHMDAQGEIIDELYEGKPTK